MKYWINTISLAHLKGGIAGGFTQANHGRDTGLRRLAKGDLVAFYSPRTDYPQGERLQRFTAIGRVTDDAPYQVIMRDDFHPWRRRLEFLTVTEVDATELIDGLSFISDKRRWGLPFRRGLFEVPAADFARIAKAMGAKL